MYANNFAMLNNTRFILLHEYRLMLPLIRSVATCGTSPLTLAFRSLPFQAVAQSKSWLSFTCERLYPLAIMTQYFLHVVIIWLSEAHAHLLSGQKDQSLSGMGGQPSYISGFWPMANCYFYPWLIRLAHSKVIMLIVIVYVTCKPQLLYAASSPQPIYILQKKLKKILMLSWVLASKKNIWSYNCM